MADQPDRQDGDGLRQALAKLATFKPTNGFWIFRSNRDVPLIHGDTYTDAPFKVVDATQPTRDGAEGARAAVQDTFDMIHQAAVDRGYDSAPPKPAPDAMEAAVILAERNFRPLSAPVPPAVAAEPVAWRYSDLRDGGYGYSDWKPDAQFNPEPLYASPSVMGDRKAIARAIVDKFPDLMRNDVSMPDDRAYRLADAILSLPVQPAIDREALAQAFALHRWNAKLENLPDDIKDGCYAFAGSVQSGAGERGSDAIEADRYFDMAGEFGNRIQRAVMLIDDYNRHGSVDHSVAFEVKKILDPESALSRQDSER